MSLRSRPSRRHGGAAEIAFLVGVLAVVSQTVSSDGLRILPMKRLSQTDVFVTNKARKSLTAGYSARYAVAAGKRLRCDPISPAVASLRSILCREICAVT